MEASNKSEFLGTTFENTTRKELFKYIVDASKTEPFRYLVTPNVDHIIRLSKEPELYTPLYDKAFLSICDSKILELLANISKTKFLTLPGSELTKILFDELIKPNDRINVIGTHEIIFEKVKTLYSLQSAKLYVPPMGLRNNPQAIAETAKFIANNPAKYNFLCVGSPQQEMIATACLERGDCTGLGLCVGASLEFLSGEKRRAPLLLQNLRLEWLFRLLSEPKRLWKRYLVSGPSIFVIWYKWNRQERNSTISFKN